MAYNYNFGHNRGNLARDSLPLFSAWEASSKIIFHGILPFSLHSAWTSREIFFFLFFFKVFPGRRHGRYLLILHSHHALSSHLQDSLFIAYSTAF